MVPFFQLVTLDNNLLYPVFEKFDYQNGVKLYRSTRWVKQFVDDEGVLWAGLRVPEKGIFTRKRQNDFHSISIRPDEREIVRKHLAMKKGVRQLVINVHEPNHSALKELLALAKPKLLAYDSHENKLRDHFYDFVISQRGMRIRLTNSTAELYFEKNTQSPGIFETFQYISALELYSTGGFQSYALLAKLTKLWLTGEDFGRIREIIVKTEDDNYSRALCYLQVLQRKTNFVTEWLENGFSIKRKKTPFGRDTVNICCRKDAGLIMMFKQ